MYFQFITIIIVAKRYNIMYVYNIYTLYILSIFRGVFTGNKPSTFWPIFIIFFADMNFSSLLSLDSRSNTMFALALNPK